MRSLGGARHLLAVAGLLLVLGAAADSAEAGCPTPPAHRPKLLLHLVAGTSKNPCADLPVLPECSGTSATAQRAGRLAPEEYIAYIVLSRAARELGIASVKFGLGYDNPLDVGVDIEDWDHCGDAVIAGPGWPASADASPLSSLTVFWAGDDCRRDPMPADTSLAHVIVGWLRVRAVTQDILGFAGENLVDTQMSDCDGATSRLSSLDLGSVSFTASGAGGGFDPCDSYKPGPGCVIAGPAAVAPGASVVYETGSLCCSVTHTSWSVSGEATVAGQSSGLTFGVLAGQEGTFEVTFNYSGTESGGCCSRTITIDPSLPVVSTTWGRIKALVR